MIKQLLKNIRWCDSAYDAMDNADAVTILTEWNEFRGLDLNRIKSLLKAPIMIDLRNIYNPKEMESAGFVYSCVGRGEVKLGKIKTKYEQLKKQFENEEASIKGKNSALVKSKKPSLPNPKKKVLFK